MWSRHVEHCDKNGFKNELSQWLRLLMDVDDFEIIEGFSINFKLNHLCKTSNKTPDIRVAIQKTINKKQIFKLIYRHIINPPKDKQVDHINCNPLDNRKCNLRLVTNAENMQNRSGASSNSKTGIRGVSIMTLSKNTKYEKQYYVATVMLNKKHVFHKQFPFTPHGLIDAEKAVIEARLKYYTHSEMDKDVACRR